MVSISAVFISGKYADV